MKTSPRTSTSISFVKTQDNEYVNMNSEDLANMNNKLKEKRLQQDQKKAKAAEYRRITKAKLYKAVESGTAFICIICDREFITEMGREKHKCTGQKRKAKQTKAEKKCKI